jgi:catechol-2,3-dioxygenase
MRIRELTLQSKDAAAQRAFYHDLLGLPVVEEDSQHVTFQAGHTRLTFEQAASALPNSTYHFAFNIPENQIMQAKDWLIARTPLAVAPDNSQQEIYDFTDWNAHAFYFLDGDGNIVEFIARHNLNNASDVPFSEDSLIGVSEMGLATPDVIRTVADLQHNLGLPVWRGAGSDMFSAVGDEHGLFIVVKTGRKWLSSDRAALPLLAQVVIEGVSGADYAVPGLPFRVRHGAMTTELR